MARSTPRVLLHSPVVRHIVTILEILSAFYALALLITLCTLHVRFVRRQGCADTISHLDPMLLTDDEERRHRVPPIIEIVITTKQQNSATPFLQCFRFSQERGFLLLSDTSLSALNVTVTTITIPSHHKCLGDTISRHMLRHVIGYDTIAVNIFARLRRRTQSPYGYVLSTHSRRVLNLLHADPGATQTHKPLATRLTIHLVRKCGAIVTAIFILCTTAALVAFTLREVQVRMIKLTIDLQLLMRSQYSQRPMGYGRVIIRYATDALVFVPIIAGMLFFLFEFFDDQALAFAVLVITWLCELAVTGSTRHWVSRSYLPKFLFYYFMTFLIYFFSFPLGFSWLSFATSISCMVHSALAIWNHCELPVLRNEHHNTHWT